MKGDHMGKRWPNAKDMQRALRKAYSTMQEAMSAHTVAFNADAGIAGLGGGDSFGRAAPPVIPLNSGPGGTSQPSTGQSGPSGGFGTMPADSQPNSQPGVRQADVKTEVYRAGDPAFDTGSSGAPV